MLLKKLFILFIIIMASTSCMQHENLFSQVQHELTQKILITLLPYEKKYIEVYFETSSDAFSRQRDSLSDDKQRHYHHLACLITFSEPEHKIDYLLHHGISTHEFSPLIALYLLNKHDYKRLIMLQADGLDMSEAIKNSPFEAFNISNQDLALVAAARAGLVAKVELLIGLGAQDIAGALCVAEEYGQVEVARFLRRCRTQKDDTTFTRAQKCTHMDDQR